MLHPVFATSTVPPNLGARPGTGHVKQSASPQRREKKIKKQIKTHGCEHQDVEG
jgi:hypothetical protein